MSAVWQKGHGVVCILALSGIVGFRWLPVNILLEMGVLEAQDDAVWSGPSQASGPLGILNTSGFSSHTPVTQVIKRAELDNMHLTGALMWFRWPVLYLLPTDPKWNLNPLYRSSHTRL